MIRTRLYRNGNLESCDFPVEQISDHLAEPDTVVWMDLCEPRREDFEVLAREFGLNPLAVEDATTERQRPKVDRYDDHLFLTVYGARLDSANGELQTAELAVFVGRRY